MTASPPNLLARADVLLCRHAPFARAMDAQGLLREAVDTQADVLAERLAAQLSRSGREMVLLCSPQERALATIRPLATLLELPVYTDPDLEELRLGRDPRLSAADTAALWAAARAQPAAPALPGAETLDALTARALATLRAAVRAGNGRLVVAVSHGGLIEAVLRAADRAAKASPRARRIGFGEAAVLRLDPVTAPVVIREPGA